MIPIAGGVASFAEEDSPFNKVVGLGFGGRRTRPPSTGSSGPSPPAAPRSVELAHLADPETGAFLTGRGYRLVSFENVLGRALTGEPERVTPPGIEVRPSGDDELEAWLDVVVDADLHPTPKGCPRMRSSRTRPSPGPSAISSQRQASSATPRCAGGSSPAAPVSARRRASPSSPARRPRPRTGAVASRPRCCRPGSPTRLPPAVTSPSSPRSRGPSPSRTCSGRGSTCSIPAPFW